MSKGFVAILVTIAVVFGGIIVFSKNDQATAPDSNGSSASQHTTGAGKKKVTLTEYGDFQCPACGAYYPIVEQILERYGDDITFQFRNFPLNQIHPNAFAAHRAAEAAHAQGKFWEMYDLLYKSQSSWTSLGSTAAVSYFEQAAGSLGLDLAKYKTDFASQTVSDIINADIKAGQSLSVTSTPSFLINDKKLDENPRDFDGFVKLIDEAIAQYGPDSSAPPADL